MPKNVTYLSEQKAVTYLYAECSLRIFCILTCDKNTATVIASLRISGKDFIMVLAERPFRFPSAIDVRMSMRRVTFNMLNAYISSLNYEATLLLDEGKTDEEMLANERMRSLTKSCMYLEEKLAGIEDWLESHDAPYFERYTAKQS